MVNRGTAPHEMVLIRLPESLTISFDSQLKSSASLAADTVADTRPLEPGATASVAADLVAGRYGLACFLQAPDQAIHALKGMNAEIRVG